MGLGLCGLDTCELMQLNLEIQSHGTFQCFRRLNKDQLLDIFDLQSNFIAPVDLFSGRFTE